MIKEKISSMKYVLFDEPYNTKKQSPQVMEMLMQARLDTWLGEGKVKVELSRYSPRMLMVRLWRQYGPWYEDPKRFSDCNKHIVDFDANIFLGTNYQTGTYADFTTHPGPYIIEPDIKSIFLPDMKEMAKRHHGTRIKSIEVDNNLDHIDLTITYV